MNERDKVASAQASAKLRQLIHENLPALKEEFALKAKICFLKYEALRGVGFGRAEAIDLCWKDL